MQNENKDFRNDQKVEIRYDGITCDINKPEYLEIVKPNLRYILSKMTKTGNSCYMIVSTANDEEYISALYDESQDTYFISAKVKSNPEYNEQNGTNHYEQRECLNEIYSVISGWFNNESKEEN